MPETIKLRIPATSANIGPGFDSIGLAVDLYNYVSMREYEGCRILSLDGVPVPVGEDNLIYSTAKRLYELCGMPFKGLEICQENNIPFARGLGSSSACVIGGLKGANLLMGKPVSDDELINIAAGIEGHPDNSTPALAGGLVTAVFEQGKVYYVKQEIRSELHFVAVVPDFELKTSVARGVLPETVARADGVFNLARAALMSVSLYSGNYRNLRVAAQDRLHQPYRLGLIPGGQQVMDCCYDLGAYAAFISGAGPTVMAIVDAGLRDFGDCVVRQLSELGLHGWKAHTLSIDNMGTVALEG